jgi:hypothetical protein
MSDTMVWVLLAAVWVGTSLLGGAVLASLAKRIYEGLNWRRLWIFYSGLLAFLVAAIMVIGWW